MLSGSFMLPFRSCFTCWCRQTCSDTFWRKKSQLHLLHLLNSCPLFPLVFEQPFKSSNANTEKRVEGAFGACSGTDWCPHAVQVALATDRVGTPGKDGGAITSRNVIAAREAAATAAEGLSIRRGSCGTPPYRGEGAREPANGAPTRLTLRNADRYHSELDSE